MGQPAQRQKRGPAPAAAQARRLGRGTSLAGAGPGTSRTASRSVMPTAHHRDDLEVEDADDFCLLPYPSVEVDDTPQPSYVSSEGASQAGGHGVTRRKSGARRASVSSVQPALPDVPSAVNVKTHHNVAFRDSDQDTSDNDGHCSDGAAERATRSDGPDRKGSKGKRTSKVLPFEPTPIDAVPEPGDNGFVDSDSESTRSGRTESVDDSDRRGGKQTRTGPGGDEPLKARSVATSSATKSATLFFHKAIERDASKTEPSLTLLTRVLYLVWTSVITLTVVIFMLDRSTMSASLTAGEGPVGSSCAIARRMGVCLFC